MNILPKKTPDSLKAEAQVILGIRFSEWPPELTANQIVNLMAGVKWRENKNLYNKYHIQVDDAIKKGTLSVRMDEVNKTPHARQVHSKDYAVGWGSGDSSAVTGVIAARTVTPETRPGKAKYYVSREACLAWLSAIGEIPSEYIAEWLRVGKVNNVPQESSKKPTPHEMARVQCETIFRKLWEIRPDITITGGPPNGSVHQPEVARFLKEFSEKWVMERARAVVPQEKKIGGRPKKL